MPSDVADYASAGTAPDEQLAISAYRGRSFVRGVVGSSSFHSAIRH